MQAAAFEIVTRGVESIAIPEHVFVEFGLPVENRNFRYQDMLYANGRFVNHWGGRGSVPDMSRLETRMWFYFLASSYIDVGIEAIHFGQVGLMDKNDPGHAHWIDMLNRVRAYARKHARRHFLLCDAHTPTGGYVEDGKLLFDFHSFPLRIVEVRGPSLSRGPPGRLCGRHLLEEPGRRHAQRLVVRAPALPGRVRQLRSEQPGKAEQVAVHLGVGRDHLVRPPARGRTQRLAPLRLEMGQGDRPQRPPTDAGQPRHDARQARRARAGTGPTREATPAPRGSTPKRRSRRFGGRDSLFLASDSGILQYSTSGSGLRWRCGHNPSDGVGALSGKGGTHDANEPAIDRECSPCSCC